MLGLGASIDRIAAGCSNWVQAPPGVQQRWCRRPTRKLAAHVAQPAAAEPIAEQQQPLISTVSPAFLDTQQLLSQPQQQQQQGLLTAACIAAAAAVKGADGWSAPDDNLSSSSTSNGVGNSTGVDGSSSNGVASSSSSNGSNNGSFHAAHYSWQAGQVEAADQADQQQQQQGLSDAAATNGARAGNPTSSSSSSLQVQVDSRGYYTYSAADLQQEQQLPTQAREAQQQQQQQELSQLLQEEQEHAQQPQAHPVQEQQQEHMQQLLQQQHHLHQQVQQPQQQHQSHQQQQQQLLLQRAKAQQQQLNSRALKSAQVAREKANRRLTGRIRDAPDLAELRQIMKQYEGVLNHIQVAALFVRLTKLVSRKQLRPRDILALPSMLPQVLSLVEAVVPEFDERGLSNCLHCMAVLELNQERALLGSLLAAAEGLMRTSRFKPQGLANMTWALGTLRLNPGPRMSAQLLAAAKASLGQFPGLELAQFGWGLVNMQIRVEQEWLGPWRAAVARVLPTLTPQGLSMLLWSTARLTDMQHVSAAAAAAAAAAAVTAGASSSSSSSGGQEWLQVAEETLLQQLPEHGPHSVSICLWALGKLGHRPRREVTSAALDAIQPQLLTSASPSDLALLLYSLAAVGYRPSRAFSEAHCAAVRRRLPLLGVRRVSNLLWAHAKLGMRPADEWLLGDLVSALQGGLGEANTRDLASSLWALATLGYTPQRGFLTAFGAQAQALVHDFSPQEISNLLWAYAKLGVKPPNMLLVALWESVGIGSAAGLGRSSSSSSSSGGGYYGSSSSGSVSARLSAFKPQELAMLVWALAVLKLVPGKAWWDQFLQSSYHKMGSQTPQSLASIIWSLSELQLQPPPAWLYHWAASARGILPSMNPVDLGQVAAALQGPTFRPLALPKLEVLLSEVLGRLSALEASSGAYSRAAVHMLLKIPGAEAAGGGAGQQGQQGGNSSGSSSSGGRVRRVALGSSSRGGGAVNGISSSGGSSSGSQQLQVAAAGVDGVGGVAAVQGLNGHSFGSDSSSSGVVLSRSSEQQDPSRQQQQQQQAEEVARLKAYLVKQSVVEAGSSGGEEVPELHVEEEHWGSASEAE